MENLYGITIKNKYEVFLDNEDPLEIIKLQEEQKLAAKKADKTKKSSLEKETKSNTKTKPIKASPVTSATETKSEKSETSTSGKSDEKQRRQKSESNDSRLLKDRGNRQTPKNDQATTQDNVLENKLEIGTFESQGGSAAPRERRGRGRGFGGGFRGNNERSPREGFDGGSERRPPRRGGFGRPRPNNFRNSENQENSQSQDDSQQDSTQGFRRGFGSNQGSDDHQQGQTGFSEEKHDQNYGEERRGGFRGGRRGFRTFNGEQRGFGSNRRNFENRPPKRNQGFRNGPTQDEHAEHNETDEPKSPDDQQKPEQPQKPESFGHWGAENETAAEDGAGGFGGGGFGSRRGYRGFGGRRGGRGRGRGSYDGRREFNRRGGGNEGGFGIKPVDKRDGTGSHNWGTVMDDLEAQNAPVEENVGGASWADQAEAADIQENAVTPSASHESESAPAAPTEPEARTMTLDEYKASLEAKRVKIGFNIRKPNEGCTDEKWKKTFVLKKKEEDKDEDEEEEDEEMEEERHNKHKNVVPIEIKFTDTRHGGVGTRGGGFGGGRRGTRGNFDRGGYNRRSGGSEMSRGGPAGERRQPRERAPNVADEKDFPSLAATTAP